MWGLQLLLVQKIINIQFFITQSNTDAPIIESKREIHNSSKLIAPVWSLKQQQNFFCCCIFRWNDLCDYVKCCFGRLYRFSPCQCYGNCNKSTHAVVFPPPSVTFWLKCKCKFAHETDGSCNTQQTNFPGFEGKGNRNPFAITYRSTFFHVVLFSSFLHSRKEKLLHRGKYSLFPQHHNLMHHANFNQLNSCNIFFSFSQLLAHFDAMHKHNMRVEDKPWSLFILGGKKILSRNFQWIVHAIFIFF